MHFRSLSREEPAETGEWAGFLTNGSSPGILAFPVFAGTSGGHIRTTKTEEAGFPITVAGPCGNLTHFPFIPDVGHPDRISEIKSNSS
jgi:hypothetical protein